MKERLQRLLGGKDPVAGLEHPTEVVEQLSKMLKTKQDETKNQAKQINNILVSTIDTFPSV